MSRLIRVDARVLAAWLRTLAELAEQGKLGLVVDALRRRASALEREGKGGEDGEEGKGGGTCTSN